MLSKILEPLFPGLVIGLGSMVVFGILEKAYPIYKNTGQTRWRKTSNVVIGLAWRMVASPTIITPAIAYFAMDFPYRWHRATWYNGWLTFALDFLLLDAMGYWLHFLGHKIPILWRFHAVHHLDTHVDSTTGIRDHFGEKVIDIIIRAPIIVLIAVPWQTVAYYEIALFVCMSFHHSNWRLSEMLERIISPIIVTPRFHHVHHGRRVRYTDSNYSLIFSFWDVLFGTRSLAVRPANFEIGLDNHPDYALPHLLIVPFISGNVKRWGRIPTPFFARSESKAEGGAIAGKQ